MKRKCKTCRWWQKENITFGNVCVCADSEEVAEFTDEDFTCKCWMPEIEQDGNATWYFDGK